MGYFRLGILFLLRRVCRRQLTRRDKNKRSRSPPGNYLRTVHDYCAVSSHPALIEICARVIIISARANYGSTGPKALGKISNNISGIRRLCCVGIIKGKMHYDDIFLRLAIAGLVPSVGMRPAVRRRQVEFLRWNGKRNPLPAEP